MEITLNELADLLRPQNPGKTDDKHQLNGYKALAVLPHGFIYYGELYDLGGGRFKLKNAYNVRYWSERSGGLPEFADAGPVSDDKIDKTGTVYIESVLFFLPLGSWSHA